MDQVVWNGVSGTKAHNDNYASAGVPQQCRSIHPWYRCVRCGNWRCPVSVTEWNITSNFLCVAQPDNNNGIALHARTCWLLSCLHAITNIGREFTLRTDHGSLTLLFRFKHPVGQLGRWLEELSQYSMTIQHRPVVKHTNADALSRIPEEHETCNCYEAGKEVSSLPWGGCP